ncbi:MAG: coiled-coil domain-containing protein [Cyclobacteriaceae bacterium]
MKLFSKLNEFFILAILLLFGTTLHAQEAPDSLKLLVDHNDQLTVELEELNKQIANFKTEVVRLESKISRLESENSSLEADIVKLKSENNYFREALALISSKPMVNGTPISYKITKVYGQEADGKIFIEGIMENKGAQMRYQPKQIQMIDPKGNILNTFKITYGGTHELGFDFVNNVPINFRIEFEKIPELFPVIKTLTMSFFDAKLNSVLFKNLNVQWD